METYVMFFASIVLTIIGFFIQRFFKAVDDIKKALDSINLKMAAREENIKEIMDDVHEIKMKQHEYGRRLHDIELQIAKTK